MTIYLAHFIGPVMEYRDPRAVENSFDISEKEIEANSKEEAWEKARKYAEEVGEGLEVVDVEETYD